VSEGDCSTATGPEADALAPTEILRFKVSERHLHWAIAGPFLICYVTALALVTIYNPDPTRPYRAFFSWAHRLSGVGLFLAPTITLLWHRRDFRIHFVNMCTAWRWRLDDIRWLLLMGPATLDKRIALPHQEKFNAAEKINFMVLTATWPIYVVTGVLIWLPGVAFLSWLIHLSMAAAATPLIFGHIFMATVNPDTRVGLSGMISGYVDRHWAHHHYRRWFEETFPHLIHAAPVADEAAVTVVDACAVIDAVPAEPERVPSVCQAPAPIVAVSLLPGWPDDEPVPDDEQEDGIPEAGWPPFLRAPSAADSVEDAA
jgi:formate dehydrogenase gamma subunit